MMKLPKRHATPWKGGRLDEYQLQWTRNILSREYHATECLKSQAACGSYSGSETVRGNMLL